MIVRSGWSSTSNLSEVELGAAVVLEIACELTGGSCSCRQGSARRARGSSRNRRPPALPREHPLRKILRSRWSWGRRASHANPEDRPVKSCCGGDCGVVSSRRRRRSRGRPSRSGRTRRCGHKTGCSEPRLGSSCGEGGVGLGTCRGSRARPRAAASATGRQRTEAHRHRCRHRRHRWTCGTSRHRPASMRAGGQAVAETQQGSLGAREGSAGWARRDQNKEEKHGAAERTTSGAARRTSSSSRHTPGAAPAAPPRPRVSRIKSRKALSRVSVPAVHQGLFARTPSDQPR